MKSNIQLKYSNYVAFRHFHGCAVNNLGKINLVNDEDEIGESFNANRKSETYISTALKSVVRCGICGGVVHVNSTSVDHIVRKRDGGLGSAENGQITHPYCNTGYKN